MGGVFLRVSFTVMDPVMEKGKERGGGTKDFCFYYFRHQLSPKDYFKVSLAWHGG